MDNKIHVGFGLHDNTGEYSKNCASVMLSILENTNEYVTFHILVDESVTVENRGRLVETVDEYNSEVIFHDMNLSDLITSNRFVDVFSVGALFRLRLPELLADVNRIIYLDADILVNMDVKKVWDFNLEGCAVGAVHMPDFAHGVERTVPVTRYGVEPDRYVNSGVLLMNLDQIRQNIDFWNEGINFINDNPDASFPDQDAINVIFKDSLILMSEDWNIPTAFERQNRKTMREGIYHFAGEKIFHWDKWNTFAEFDKKYLRLKQITPWGFVDTEEEILRMLSMAYSHIDLSQKVLKKASRRDARHIFYGNENNQMKNMMLLLDIHAEDCFISKVVTAGEQRMGLPVYSLDELKFNKESDVIFVAPDADGGQAMNNLNDLGLANEEDYFVIPMLLKYDQGGYIF